MFFLIFALKHRLWVLVRTASETPKIYVLSINKKKVQNFHLKIIIFKAVKNCNNLHRRVFVMSRRYEKSVIVKGSTCIQLNIMFV